MVLDEVGKLAAITVADYQRALGLATVRVEKLQDALAAAIQYAQQLEKRIHEPDGGKDAENPT